MGVVGFRVAVITGRVKEVVFSALLGVRFVGCENSVVNFGARAG